MLRRISFKIGTLFAITLMILMSFNATKALAASTMGITVFVPHTFTCQEALFNSEMQSLSTTTYNYDDGTYKGTLHYAGYSDLTSSIYAIYPSYTVRHYYFNINYSGIVTKYGGSASMQITAYRHISITAPLSAADGIKQSMANTTYSYDDGNYRGTLSYIGLTNWTQTYYGESNGYTLYSYDFDVIYSGTVTSYQIILILFGQAIINFNNLMIMV